MSLRVTISGVPFLARPQVSPSGAPQGSQVKAGEKKTKPSCFQQQEGDIHYFEIQPEYSILLFKKPVFLGNYFARAQPTFILPDPTRPGRWHIPKSRPIQFPLSPKYKS